MSERIVILSGAEIPSVSEDTGTGFSAERQSAPKAMEKLERAWPEIMVRLRRILESDRAAQADSFAVDTVQFGIKIEAGFDIVVSGTASADATITFKRHAKPGG